jgi:redox-sensitive bicupin YhaK (pirin superfamily)
MIILRKADERGHSDLGWLNSYHTFSFGGYSDPQHMGFRSLRVINDDRVAPGKGFGAHGHRDMEILSYVIDGRLAHKDSMGERHVLGPNEVQAMTAGSGVIHSEFNGSGEQPVHFLQIWIKPSAKDLAPAYEQFAYDPAEKRGRLRLMAGPDPRDSNGRSGAARINQDARMYAAVLAPDQTVGHDVAAGRGLWVHCVQGEITVNGTALREGDGAAVTDVDAIVLTGAGTAGGELLLFDLA